MHLNERQVTLLRIALRHAKVYTSAIQGTLAHFDGGKIMVDEVLVEEPTSEEFASLLGHILAHIEFERQELVLPSSGLEREKLVLQAALAYTSANVDDLNDVMAEMDDVDPDNEKGQINVCGTTTDSLDDAEIVRLSIKLGIPIAD